MEYVDGFTVERVAEDEVHLIFSSIQGEAEGYSFSLADAQAILMGLREVLLEP